MSRRPLRRLAFLTIRRRLAEHPAFAEIDEVASALPFTFQHEDFVQILTDMAEAPGPALGWNPTAAAP